MPARVLQGMACGEQEQAEEEREEQRDDDEIPIHFGAAGKAHPGHGYEPERRQQCDADCGGMHCSLSLAQAKILLGAGCVELPICCVVADEALASYAL